MEPRSLSYREVIPSYFGDNPWVELSLNIGSAQSTLQDIKIAEKAGGYCYKNLDVTHNRLIYWRTYQDVIELTEISLDYNLYHNKLRLKFIDAPVLSVSIIEKDALVVLLVVTVCSLHYIAFPHPDAMADNSSTIITSEFSRMSMSSDYKNLSIFCNINASVLNNPNSFYVIETLNGAPTNAMPHVSNCYMSHTENKAYFAMAMQSYLSLYIMNCSNGHVTEYHLKEHQLMPRLFSNLKDALTGKSDAADSDCVISMEFISLNEQIYLLALNRNDELRIWSAFSHTSIGAINCNKGSIRQRQQGPQTNALRKINESQVCAFISHTGSSKFVVIDIVLDNSSGDVYLVINKEIHALKLDLADFDVSESRIWALWSNAEGEFSISNYSYDCGVGNWITAAMEPPPDRYCIGIEQGMDPREAYCSYILHPGKFDRDVISKALFMFRRSNIRFDAKSCSLSLLKEHVYAAVEEEIQNDLKDYQTTDEDYVETSRRLWERFYTCCEQYHMKNCQPTGLFILPSIDAVCLIKKNNYSLLRPCESLEHLMLAGENVDIDNIVTLQFAGNEQIGTDLVHTVAILAMLEKWLPDDVKIEMDKKLYRLELPSVLIENISNEILMGNPENEILPKNFMSLLKQKLQVIIDLRTAMSFLIDSLRIDNGNPEAMQTDTCNMYSPRMVSVTLCNLFASDVGLSIMCETVRQTAMIRFAICRNLLIFDQILLETFLVPMDVLDVIRNHFMPDLFTFLQCYYSMVWIAEKPVNLAQIASNEAAKNRLVNAKLIKCSEHIWSSDNKNQYTSLLQMFLKAKGLHTAITLCADNLKSLTNVSWQLTLLPLNTIISQLIWPVSSNFIFGEWLCGTCQHIIIEDYVRLLRNWCDWNACSRQFILATSLLECGDTQKAYDYFVQSSEGVLREQFLLEKILQNTDIYEEVKCIGNLNVNTKHSLDIRNRAIAQYYLKVIELFEQHNALDHIIALANLAIGILEENDTDMPMFQSIVFNNHLQLEHYDEAYHSLIHNKELSRRKDCLRQLVVTLFHCKRFDLLVNFPYINLQVEFERIVESKARSLPIESNEIYDFLYAYHVNNGNMRKASAMMYEQSLRLKLESDTIEAMQNRRNSLLACLNCLYLIDERYRWIAKPVLNDEIMENGSANDSAEIVRKVEVLEIDDIKKELLQTLSLIRLAEHRNDAHTFLNAGAQELVFIMANSGLYTDAIRLAKCFKISLLPVFDSLTAACVRCGEQNANDVWEWLQENDLADLPHRNSGADIAWLLLQKLIENNELENSTEIRKTVVNKLCLLNAFVPQWLINEYKKENVSELLRLLVKHYRYMEATALAVEMLNAMIGVGSEYFPFKHAIAVTSPDMCLPINTIDLLLLGLQQNSKEDIEYKQALAELEETLDKYLKIAQRTAQDKLSMLLNKG